MNRQGFTFLEILLVVALVGILAGLSLPIYNIYKERNDIDVAVNTTAGALRRAQVLSQAVDGDTSWGVYIDTNNIIIFKGTNYAGRDTDFDEEYNLSRNFTVSGLSEVVFAKFTGLPQSTGDIILTTNNNESRTITINSQGMLEY